MTYPVHEIFRSFQGEGAHAGRAAVFVRLAGCPVRCPWCDSAETWKSDARLAQQSPNAAAATAAEILAALPTAPRGAIAVITGGEPSIHDLAPLCDALHAADFAVHLETCGAFALRGAFDWVTVSPKWLALPRPENLARASELKLIITEPSEIAKWAEFLNTKNAAKNASGKPAAGTAPRAPIFLHPEWSRRADAAVLGAITDWVSAHGDPWRAGWQLHKNYAAR
jgi:organic radical activating enzyme